jgi:hypothetical protein
LTRSLFGRTACLVASLAATHLRQMIALRCAVLSTDLWLFVGLSVAFANHFVIGLLIAGFALPAHTLPLPGVWGYLVDDSKRGLCTCCCSKAGPVPSPPRRPARGMVLRLWSSILVAAQVRYAKRRARGQTNAYRIAWQCFPTQQGRAVLQVAHSPPALLAFWLLANDGSTSGACAGLVQVVKTYAAAPAGCTPWLPFVRC